MLKVEEIREKFFENGYFLSENLLNFLVENPNYIEKVLEYSLKNIDKFNILTEKVLEKIISENFNFKIVEDKLDLNNEITILNFSNIVKERFEYFKEILSKKILLTKSISISNLRKNHSNVSVIGIILEINKNTNKVLIEDLNGSVYLKASNEILEQLVEDEVAAFIVDNMEIKKVIFPDIPIEKEAKKIDEEIFLIFGFKTNFEALKEKSYIFIDENSVVKNGPKSKIIFYKDFLRSFVENFEILILNGNYLKNYFYKDGQKTILNLLKKRNLNPSLKLNPSNNLILKDIPDFIVFYNSGFDSFYFNYKGTTILCLEENTYFNINLKSREIFLNHGQGK